MKKVEYLLLGGDDCNRKIVVKDLLADVMFLSFEKGYNVTIEEDEGYNRVAKNGLNKLWCQEIATSGKGRSQHADSINNDCKYMFALPIKLRDDVYFSDLWVAYKKEYSGAEDWSKRAYYFISECIRVGDMNDSQFSEYLSLMRKHWEGKGVELTKPKDKGVEL